MILLPTKKVGFWAVTSTPALQTVASWFVYKNFRIFEICKHSHCTHLCTQVPTASVFQPVDGVGQEANTAQETCTLLFVDLLMVPYADGD